ncbi:MAG TPA: hypothetical protein VMH36_26055 [Alphaproteobacteria bacterium]|nr:hypothetical protein [Alphaproteobacteria bacterium]
MRMALLAAAAVLIAGAPAGAVETQVRILPGAPPGAAEALAARPAVAQPAAAEAPAGAAGFRMAPLDTYAEVLRRPLFASDRRAHEAVQAAAVDEPFTLRGIVIQPAAAYALVEEGKTTKRVTEGQALGRGTVTRILHDRVVLSVNGVETAVKLFDPKANGKPSPGLSTAGGISSQMPPGYQPPVSPNRPTLSGG